MKTAENWLKAAWVVLAVITTITYGIQHVLTGFVPQVFALMSYRIYALLFGFSCVYGAVKIMQSHSGRTGS